MAMTEDLTIFFDTDEFAVSATYNVSTTVLGLFGNAYFLVNDVESKRPTFVCSEADVSALAFDDTFVISSVTYKVKGIHPDGQGLVTAMLEKQ